MDRANPSEMDIQVFIPAPTFFLQSIYCMIRKWKNSNISSIKKIEIKIEMACLQSRRSINKWFTK